MCLKASLSVRCLPNSYWKECIILEVSINNKRGYVVSLYRSPIQTSDEFYLFIINLEKIVRSNRSNRSNPHFVLIICDFNAKSSNWSSNDTTTAEGAQSDYFTSVDNMKQVITEPMHILESSASCIGLIFTNQQNNNMDFEVNWKMPLPNNLFFDWFYLFSGKNMHEQVELFNKNVTKYFSQFHS